MRRSDGQFCRSGKSAPVPNVSDASIATNTSVGLVVAVGVTWGPEGVATDVVLQPASSPDRANVQASSIESRALGETPESFWLSE